jgi:hypothetical protein
MCKFMDMTYRIVHACESKVGYLICYRTHSDLRSRVKVKTKSKKRDGKVKVWSSLCFIMWARMPYPTEHIPVVVPTESIRLKNCFWVPFIVFT